MSDALKPCPFCGQPPHARHTRANPWAGCKTEGCWGAKLPIVSLDSPRDIEAWNTRASDAQLAAAEAPMPEPIGRLYFGGVTCGERDEWEFDADQVVCDGINESATEESRQRVYLHRDVRTYGVQCRAAGYAAGVAACQDALADACCAAEIPDSKYESLMIALHREVKP